MMNHWVEIVEICEDFQKKNVEILLWIRYDWWNGMDYENAQVRKNLDTHRPDQELLN